MLIVSRHLTQQFEWQMHYPLAIEAGLAKVTADALARGARPRAMREDEAAVRLGERGVVDLVGLVGYFMTVSLVMNVAHTPAPPQARIVPLEPFPS